MLYLFPDNTLNGKYFGSCAFEQCFDILDNMADISIKMDNDTKHESFWVQAKNTLINGVLAETMITVNMNNYT